MPTKYQAFLASIFLAAFVVNSPSLEIRGGYQQSDLVGPLLISTTIGSNRVITLYDVGSGQTHTWERAEDPFFAGAWSPDGCKILIERGGEYRWGVLSLADFEIQPIRISTIVSPPIWTPTGNTLTFTEHSQDGNSAFHNVNIADMSTHLLFSAKGRAAPDKWLSSSELLYVNDGLWFVWDEVSRESQPFPADNQLASLDRLLEVEALSPDRHRVSKFFDLSEYEYLSNPEPEVEENTRDWVRTVESYSGFKLVNLDDETTVEVPMEGQFLQSLEWSPSGRQILVSTDALTTADALNGLYIYDLVTQELMRVGDFPAMRWDEFRPYVPTWSADELWVALNTVEGHLIYNLQDGQTIELGNAFDIRNLRLEWSPIMDYTDTTCDAIE